jgi:RES domain-containing protein
MVHLEIEGEDIPISFRYLQIEAPDGASLEAADSKLPDAKWKTRTEVTRQIGDEWLTSGRSALLLVPCVIVPATMNVLINPVHPESNRIRVVGVYDQPIDSRLLRA